MPYDDTPCWGCGSTGEHPTLGGHYWPCGTMKCATIRGEQCYENEIGNIKEVIRFCLNSGELPDALVPVLRQALGEDDE